MLPRSATRGPFRLLGVPGALLQPEKTRQQVALLDRRPYPAGTRNLITIVIISPLATRPRASGHSPQPDPRARRPIGGLGLSNYLRSTKYIYTYQSLTLMKVIIGFNIIRRAQIKARKEHFKRTALALRVWEPSAHRSRNSVTRAAELKRRYTLTDWPSKRK